MTRRGLLQMASQSGHDNEQIEDVLLILYTHGYISYIYSECEYLPVEMASDAQAVLKRIEQIAPTFNTLFDVNQWAPVFAEISDSAHHAIIPTTGTGSSDSTIDELHPLAREIYLMIANSYAKAISSAGDLFD